MRFLFSVVVSISFLYACSSKKAGDEVLSIEQMKEVIKQQEDSLSLFQKQNKSVPREKQYTLIQSLLDFYRTYPKDKYAPVCLDKIQMSYSGLGVYEKAIRFSDTLINNYPNYINRPMILESQASNFDIFYEPRDTSKIRYYYTLLLKENPTMNKDKKQGIEMRLKHLNLTFDEYIAALTSSVHP